MDWQQPVSLVMVAGAVSGLLWRQFRPRRFSFLRDTHCGCSGGAGEKSSIVVQGRRGEAQRVVVKMK